MDILEAECKDNGCSATEFFDIIQWFFGEAKGFVMTWMFRWLPQNPDVRKTAVAFIVISIIEALLVQGNEGAWPLTWLAQFNRDFIDAAMREHIGEVNVPSKARAFIFIDIDDDTYKLWGEPPYTPHTRLAELIRFSAEGGAALIIDDIDPGELNEPNDQMATLIAQYQSDESRINPSLIFPIDGISAGRTEEMVRHINNKNNKNIFYGVPQVLRDSDFMVRRWKLWYLDCKGNFALPSVPLLAFSILNGYPVARLQASLSSQVIDACQHPEDNISRSITIGSNTINLGGRGLSERILFTHLKQTLGGDRVSVGGVRVPMLSVIPARLISNADHHAVLNKSAVRGRVVIIGASHRFGRDTHLTPIGAMPGSVVLVNAVSTLLQYGQLSRPSPLTGFVFGVAVAMALWSCVEFLRVPIAALGVGLIMTALFYGVGRMSLTEGVWIDALLPSLGALACDWLLQIGDLWRNRNAGWRLILKRGKPLNVSSDSKG